MSDTPSDTPYPEEAPPYPMPPVQQLTREQVLIQLAQLLQVGLGSAQQMQMVLSQPAQISKDERDTMLKIAKDFQSGYKGICALLGNWSVNP